VDEDEGDGPEYRAKLFQGKRAEQRNNETALKKLSREVTGVDDGGGVTEMVKQKRPTGKRGKSCKKHGHHLSL